VDTFYGLGVRVSVPSFGFRVSGSGFRVSDLLDDREDAVLLAELPHRQLVRLVGIRACCCWGLGFVSVWFYG
jgi:hypothetical protein